MSKRGHDRTALGLVGSFVLLLFASGAVAQQQPGECGYYVNPDGRTVPRSCGNAKE